MRVLFALQPNIPNSVIRNICEGIQQQKIQLEISLEEFWNSGHSYDIIHIQWPEALIKWQRPSPELIEKVISRLRFWKGNNTKILVTRHNYLPHLPHPLNEQLYRSIYEWADGVIHLGDYSHREFIQRYPALDAPNHMVIPHPVYTNLPNQISKSEARKLLKLPGGGKVFIVFGKTRTLAEQEFIIKGFRKLNLKNKVLIFCTGILPLPEKVSGTKAPVRFLRRAVKKTWLRWYYSLSGVKIFDRFVPEEDIQIYMNAADVVIIQRLGQLNSGNLPLAYTFKKVAIGPNTGNIGEILKKTNNPAFSPLQTSSLVNAMQEGIRLSGEKQGEKNFKTIRNDWSIESVVALHVQFYKEIVASEIHL